MAYVNGSHMWNTAKIITLLKQRKSEEKATKKEQKLKH